MLKRLMIGAGILLLLQAINSEVLGLLVLSAATACLAIWFLKKAGEGWL